MRETAGLLAAWPNYPFPRQEPGNQELQRGCISHRRWGRRPWTARRPLAAARRPASVCRKWMPSALHRSASAVLFGWGVGTLHTTRGASLPSASCIATCSNPPRSGDQSHRSARRDSEGRCVSRLGGRTKPRRANKDRAGSGPISRLIPTFQNPASPWSETARTAATAG